MAAATKPPKRNSWANGVSGSPDKVEAGYVDTGFPAPAGVPVKPVRGNVNHEFNRYDEGLNYIMQNGICGWAPDETDYPQYAVVLEGAKLYQLFGAATPATAPSADAANWALFHRMPRPISGETVVNEIAAWSNARGRRITGKDHYGFDAGPILDFREDWLDASAADKTATAAAAAWFGRWRTAIDNGGGFAGLISAPGPYVTDLSTRPWGPIVTVRAFGQSVDAVSIVETAKPIIKMSGASLVFEVWFSVNGGSGPQTTTFLSFGLGDGTVAANRMMGSIGAGGVMAYGAWIEANGGQPWSVYSRPNGGAISTSATGVSLARDVPHRYRCYVLGTSDSDDSTARVIHLIDNSIVGNHTVSLLNQMLYPFIRATAQAGEVCDLVLGPMRIQARMALGDVLL